MGAQTQRGLPGLSKSRFQAGLQCPKQLWLLCHRPELADPLTAAQEAVFATGHQVGALARGRFPGGLLVEDDHEHGAEALATTARLLQDGAPCLYEAAFEYDGVFVRADVLQREEAGRHLIEVKSSTKAKPEHISDVAVQAYVITGAGYPVTRVSVLHLEPQYLFSGGAYDLEQLFRLVDVGAEVAEWLPSVPERISEMKSMLTGDCPELPIGRGRCRRPYDCRFIGHCYDFLPAYPVTDLPRLDDDLLASLLAQGVHSVTEVPLTHPGLNAKQRTVCYVARQKAPLFQPGLAGELAPLEAPVHFLDFETVNPALPCYPGTRPYQQVPTQWSCHTLHADGSVTHAGFIHTEATDPRPAFIERLLAHLTGSGPIVVYSGFEQRVLQDVSLALPERADPIAALRSRLVDLMGVITRNVAHPDFHGRASLKLVLPALCSGPGYDGLAISDGQEASRRYAQAVFGEVTEDERQRTFADLRAYCATDTMGLVRLFLRLKEVCVTG